MGGWSKRRPVAGRVWLTEVVLADLPVALGKRIEWDGENMKATNAPGADILFQHEYRKGWEVEELQIVKL